MSYAGKQELQIVEAFSTVELPQQIFAAGKIPELIQRMADARSEIDDDGARLSRLRREKADGNFVTNWWNDLDDRIQSASLDLSQSIGSLTQRSAELLVINTAISKVLSDQQETLLRQQQVLRSQAEALATQNTKILEQQDQLSAQQDQINAANQGLMEAKGLTQEQAMKLVGCVQRVEQAEAKMTQSHANLLTEMNDRFASASKSVVDSVRAEQKTQSAGLRFAAFGGLALAVVSLVVQAIGYLR